MFFEGMRSERQLERVGSDRLSVRWYVGYDLDEPLPDHSSMTRIRERYGIHIFRRFFEAIVEQCRETGLVWGQELYADGTLVEANADRDKMLPRFAVEAHLQQLFAAANVSPLGADDVAPAMDTTEPGSTESTPPLSTPVRELDVDLSSERRAALTAHNQARHDWYARNGEPDRSIKRGGYQRTSDLWVSLTDPDAVLMRQHNHGVKGR
jgi:hypothetical protein